MNFPAIVMGYFIGISLTGIILACSDKSAARKNRRRVPERRLMTVGLLGGALAMYITMRVIRHKTLHKKFMWGLPAMIIAHAVLSWLLWGLA